MKKRILALTIVIVLAALAFAGSAPQFHMIGDCAGGGNIMTAVKNAYTIARDL